MPMPVRSVVQGLPQLQWKDSLGYTRPCLNQPPFFHSKRKALRTVTTIKVVIVSRREPGNSCMLVVKIKMARLGSHGSPGWTNKRPSCFSLLCVRIHVCVTMPAFPSFQKQLDCANIFWLCSTLPLLSASSSNVHILVLAFFFHMWFFNDIFRTLTRVSILELRKSNKHYRHQLLRMKCWLKTTFCKGLAIWFSR